MMLTRFLVAFVVALPLLQIAPSAMLRRSLRRFIPKAPDVVGRPLTLVECPRDAMQGLKEFVPTHEKIRFINALLKCGFHTVDCGSFVSAPAVPQMRDTATVLEGLDMDDTKSKLLVVVCNVKGAKKAVLEEKVTYVGYPLSASEKFQHKNTNRDISQALQDVAELKKVCDAGGKELVVYISMGFGNPYGEPFSADIVADLAEKVAKIGVKIISLADTVGVSAPPLIKDLFGKLIPKYPDVEFGAHFHSGAVSSRDKVNAAMDAGCRRFDGALGGMGGCPFAKSTLVGNVSSEALTETLAARGVDHGIDMVALDKASKIKHEVFGVGVKEILLASVLSNEKEFMELCIRHFRAADKRGVGYLDEDAFCSSLSHAYSELGEIVPSRAKLVEKFKKLDITGDSRITLEEYMMGVRRGLKKRLMRMEEEERGHEA